MQNSQGSGIYCREELLSLGARASRPHKTWQGRGDWLHRVGRFTRRLTLEQRLDKYAGGTPALPGGNPWLARCRSLSRALFCRSILPPSHARLRILQKAQKVYPRVAASAVSVNVRRPQVAKKPIDIFFPFLPLRDQEDRFQMRAAFRPRIFSRSSGLKKVISSLTRASSSARVGRS